MDIRKTIMIGLMTLATFAFLPDESFAQRGRAGGARVSAGARVGGARVGAARVGGRVAYRGAGYRYGRYGYAYRPRVGVGVAGAAVRYGSSCYDAYGNYVCGASGYGYAAPYYRPGYYGGGYYRGGYYRGGRYVYRGRAGARATPYGRAGVRAGYARGGYRSAGVRGGVGRGGRRSDIRLKYDVVLLGHLANGLGFYRFSYIGSTESYVGVLAQEVQQVAPQAVTRGRDGYLRVFYDRLGLKFERYDQWRKEGAHIPSGVDHLQTGPEL